jgi:hypothetical protein
MGDDDPGFPRTWARRLSTQEQGAWLIAAKPWARGPWSEAAMDESRPL